MFAVDLLLAEVVVLVWLTLWQSGIAENHRLGIALKGEFFAVQVVAILDRPVHLDRIARVGHHVAIRLFGSQWLSVLRVGERHGHQQRQHYSSDGEDYVH